MKIPHLVIYGTLAAPCRFMSGLAADTRVFLLCVLILGAVGCTQKDLYMPEEEMCLVDVRFLWDKAGEADPGGMTLLFYPLETRGNFWRYDIAGRDGGLLEIAPGTYTMIAVNNDLRNVSLSDISYYHTVAAVARPAGTGMAEPTGMLYEGIVERIAVQSRRTFPTECNAPSGLTPDAVVECSPDSASSVCTVRLIEADGLEQVRGIEGTLEGCSQWLMLASGQVSDAKAGVSFPLDVYAEEMMARGSVSGFLGHDGEAGYTLVLRARYFNGRMYEKKINITDEVLNYPYPHNVDITIKGLIFPENPSHTEGDDALGIDVDVDGWHIIEINIDTAN